MSASNKAARAAPFLSRIYEFAMDTSQAATNTIDYVVTDSAGLTSTRTVIIETVSE